MQSELYRQGLVGLKQGDSNLPKRSEHLQPSAKLPQAGRLQELLHSCGGLLQLHLVGLRSGEKQAEEMEPEAVGT